MLAQILDVAQVACLVVALFAGIFMIPMKEWRKALLAIAAGAYAMWWFVITMDAGRYAIEAASKGAWHLPIALFAFGACVVFTYACAYVVGNMTIEELPHG